MSAKYKIGQKIIIKPVKNQQAAPVDCDLETYAGKRGEVTNYYWISTGRKEIFYMYTVLIDDYHKDIVLHEDEIQAYTG